jgi:hypothetical protein
MPVLVTGALIFVNASADGPDCGVTEEFGGKYDEDVISVPIPGWTFANT